MSQAFAFYDVRKVDLRLSMILTHSLISNLKTGTFYWVKYIEPDIRSFEIFQLFFVLKYWPRILKYYHSPDYGLVAVSRGALGELMLPRFSPRTTF